MTISRRAVLAAGGAAMVSTGCGTTRSASSPAADSVAAKGNPVTVTNCSESLRFDQVPRRVVSTYPSMTELMLALGLRDRLAGHINTELSPPSEEYADEFAKVEVLSPGEPSVEVLLSARPDLIVADGPYHFDGKRLPAIADLEERGIQVYVNQQFCEGKKLEGRVEQAYTDLANLGKIFDVRDQANALVDKAKSDLADVRQRLDGRPPVRTALVTLYEKSLYVDAGGLYTDVLELAGGENLTAQSELPPGEYYGQVSAETVAKKNPDAIVFTYLDEESERTSKEWLRMAFAETSAVRQDRLISTPEATFSGALRSFPGVTSLAEALHPDAF